LSNLLDERLIKVIIEYPQGLCLLQSILLEKWYQDLFYFETRDSLGFNVDDAGDMVKYQLSEVLEHGWGFAFYKLSIGLPVRQLTPIQALRDPFLGDCFRLLLWSSLYSQEGTVKKGTAHNAHFWSKITWGLKVNL
jgi:hypothetical protein